MDGVQMQFQLIVHNYLFLNKPVDSTNEAFQWVVAHHYQTVEKTESCTFFAFVTRATVQSKLVERISDLDGYTAVMSAFKSSGVKSMFSASVKKEGSCKIMH